MANLQLKKCGNRSFLGDDDDLISQLPDEILIEILSLLSLKEAARTSVLSPRWMNLWKHTPSLNFDVDQKSLLDKFYRPEELLKTERPKYVKWVNSVIRSHESLTLKEFRIRFHLNKSSRKAITRWLRFAFSRRVQRLELDLKNYCGPGLFKTYVFPDELLTLSGSSDSVCIGHRMVLGFKSLKALVLKNVSLRDGAIESFLHNCPLLEQLTVFYSYESKISKVEVCGSSLKLKHLEIDGFAYLKSIKVVSVPRLTTLIVVSSYNYKTLLLENVPMLVNVSIRCGDDDISIQHVFNAVLSCCISQLQTLCLALMSTEYSREIRGEIDELCVLPKMPKLKKLVVGYLANGFENLIRLTPLIRLSPNLEEFELQVKWYRERKDREVRAPMLSPHHHLKVFKFRGYYGSSNDVELLSYILENCPALEKITVDVDPLVCEDHLKLEVEETARKNAKEKLAPQVPQHVELVIL